MKLLLTDYEEYLADLAKGATNVKVLIAFLTDGGLNWLPKPKIEISEFIIGIDLGVTSPSAIKYLLKNGADVSIFNEPGKMFHPKAIYIETNEKELLLIGSNNLTTGGISSNHEISVSVTRNEKTNVLFEDFLAHFELLKNHKCCSFPGDEFFRNYKQSMISKELQNKIHSQKQIPLQKHKVPSLKNYPAQIDTLNKFIKLLAEKYPHLDRSRNKPDIKKHPLKVLNDNQFTPLFEEIVSEASKSRLEAVSQLNIGGNWYMIPNILAKNEDTEPWERSYENGRLVLQIHFSEDYQKVFLSAVLQYNIDKSIKSGEMPTEVEKRFRKLKDYADNSASDAKYGLSQFHHWNYKNYSLWGKPIISFVYDVSSLPPNKTLLENIQFLSQFVNASTAVY